MALAEMGLKRKLGDLSQANSTKGSKSEGKESKEVKKGMKKICLGMCCFFACMVIFSGLAVAQNKHEKLVKNYTGTESCSTCHKSSAIEVAESLHYLQLAEPRLVVNWPKDKLAGMMDSF